MMYQVQNAYETELPKAMKFVNRKYSIKHQFKEKKYQLLFSPSFITKYATLFLQAVILFDMLPDSNCVFFPHQKCMIMST